MAVEDSLCKICMDSPIDCVLLECGHMVTCTKCGKRMSECPICRQYVVRAVHVFRSWVTSPFTRPFPRTTMLNKTVRWPLILELLSCCTLNDSELRSRESPSNNCTGFSFFLSVPSGCFEEEALFFWSCDPVTCADDSKSMQHKWPFLPPPLLINTERIMWTHMLCCFFWMSLPCCFSHTCCFCTF